MVLAVHGLRIVSASQYVIFLIFLQPILYGVICRYPDSVAALRHPLHSHLCMAQCKKCHQIFLDLDAQISDTPY